MCMHKKRKNESHVKYKVNEIEIYKSSLKFLHNHKRSAKSTLEVLDAFENIFIKKKKKEIENFHDGNILTIFLIF